MTYLDDKYFVRGKLDIRLYSDPDIDGRICDLASGSGGFLVGAYQHIITKYSEEITPDNDGKPKGTNGRKLSPKQRKQLEEKTFFGFDIDQTMVRIGVMNLMMHSISKPNIEYLDSLSARYEELEANRLNTKIDINDRESLSNPELQASTNIYWQILLLLARLIV